MCTVSWLRHEHGYELFCNRDERKTRLAAQPPRVRELDGVKFIAPTDMQHGGSWLAVNGFGTTLCLLNRYDQVLSSARQRAPISRGLLLNELAASATSEQVATRLANTALSSFQPFTLAVLTLHAPAELFQWNGVHLKQELAPSSLLTSSSYDSLNIIAQRQDHFAALTKAEGGITAKLLHRFHHSHEPLSPTAAVCMHREDAHTVSFSQVSVSPQQVAFRYSPQSPCCSDDAHAHHVSLPLAHQ